jgi:hypothetical protein
VRRFHLHRTEDETGTSGTGIVAEGCVFTDGNVALRWLSTTPSWILHTSLENMEKVHGHNGKTKIIWKDE